MNFSLSPSIFIYFCHLLLPLVLRGMPVAIAVCLYCIYISHLLHTAVDEWWMMMMMNLISVYSYISFNSFHTYIYNSIKYHRTSHFSHHKPFHSIQSSFQPQLPQYPLPHIGICTNNFIFIYKIHHDCMYDINVLIRDNEYKTFLLCENEGESNNLIQPVLVPITTHLHLIENWSIGSVSLPTIQRHTISISIQLAEYGVRSKCNWKKW